MPDDAVQIRGHVVNHPLAGVRPNGWNPNTMSKDMMDSLKHGLVADGWLASQALLVWGTDDAHDDRNVIIDGEHRWTAATELGMKTAPMVFLHGLSEVAAKALTIKMNQKRGEWDQAGLLELVRQVQEGSSFDNPALEFGMSDDLLSQAFAQPAEEIPPPVTNDPATGGAPEPGTTTPPGPPALPSTVRMVQLFLDDKSQPKFLEAIQALSKVWGTKNLTDTAFEAVIRAAAAS